jgi:hypothetical protein
VDEGKTNLYKISDGPGIICEDLRKRMSWMNISNCQGFFWQAEADKSVLCCYDFVLGRIIWRGEPQDFDVDDIKTFELSGVVLMTGARDSVLLHYISGEQAAREDVKHMKAWLYDRGLYILNTDGLFRYDPPYREARAVSLPDGALRAAARGGNIPCATGAGRAFFAVGGSILSYAAGDSSAKIFVSADVGEEVICISVAEGSVIYAVKKGAAADIRRVDTARQGAPNHIARGITLAAPKLCVADGYLYTCEKVNSSYFFRQYPISGGYLAESLDSTLIDSASRVFNYYAVTDDEGMFFIYISANSSNGFIEVCELRGNNRRVLKTCSARSRPCLAMTGASMALVDAALGQVTDIYHEDGK